MKYKVESGVYNLGFELSLLEKKLFIEFEDMLDGKGFRYLSIPSLTRWNNFERQSIEDIFKSLSVDHIHNLSGSAEQGILQYFSDSIVELQLIYSKNQCFRHENYGYEGLKRCKEFVKLEQFCFCNDYDWKENFDLLLTNATSFLNKYNIEFRVVDVSKLDLGYHIKKYDIEVKTKQYGWMETHSCTYFGEEQSKRFGITGATHTISNTGIASPRILIPFIEMM